MVELVFTVKIKSTHSDHQRRDSKESEADNIRDCILDGMGYPLSLDSGELTIDVTCDSITHTEGI